jgi:hypothetical protein
VGNVAVGGAIIGTTLTCFNSNTTGANNTALGNSALANNTTASYNTAVGYQAGYANTTGYTPDVNPQDGKPNSTTTFSIPTPSTGSGYTALRPGDVILNISGVGVNASDLKIQSFTLSTDIGRDPIQKLGSKYAFSREITFPVTVKATVEAVIGDIGGTDVIGNALTDIVCNDGTSYNLVFALGQPSTDCDAATLPSPYALRYTLKGAKLDSQAISSSIGDNKSVTLGFSAQIGGPNDTNKGLFIESNVS